MGQATTEKSISGKYDHVPLKCLTVQFAFKNVHDRSELSMKGFLIHLDRKTSPRNDSYHSLIALLVTINSVLRQATEKR